MAVESTPGKGRTEMDAEDVIAEAPRGVIGRRAWLLAGGTLAAGAGLSAFATSPARASTGDDVVAGHTNICDKRTDLINFAAASSCAMYVALTNASDDIQPTGAVVGYTDHNVPGVHGVAVNWNGVIGESPNVVGVVGRSTKDAGVLGESTNSYGVVGRSDALTGVWGQGPAYGVRGDSPKTGVWGNSTGASGNYAGVEGDSTNNPGVRGSSTNASGVVGQSNVTGVLGNGQAYGVRGVSARTGVWGNSTGANGSYAGVQGTSTNNWGVRGESTSAEGISGVGGTYGGAFGGGRAAVRLVPTATPGAPTTGQHLMGEMLCDSAGNLWFCRKAGTPGTWKKVKFA